MPPRISSARIADVVFDAFYSAGIGGAAVALFFLATDTLAGTPLLTPSILGSSIFLGVDASGVSTVRLDAVALYTAFHFAACSILGTLVAVLVHAIEHLRLNSLRVLFATFVLLQVGFLALAALVMPDVVTRIGVVPIGAANLVAATGVALFLRASRGWRAAAVSD